MKVLEIIPALLDGGAERFVIDLSNELCRDHELVLCFQFDADPAYQQMIDNLDATIRIVFLGKKLGVDLSQVVKIGRLLREERPDVVHSHLQSITYVSICSLLFRRIAFFHTVHNDAFKEVCYKWELGFRRFFFRRKLITPITISPDSKASFLAAYGLDAPMINNGRSTPVKTGLYENAKEEINTYKSTSQTKIYVHLGRVEAQKNQLMLINAFRRFQESVSADAVLLLIGSIRDQKLGEQLVGVLAEEKRIHYLGSRSNATDYLHCADFFCLSSLHEGLPISLLEAMACEATPICTPVGGIPSVIRNDESGILSQDTTEDSYVRALVRSYRKLDIPQLKANAKGIYQMRFSMDNCAAQYSTLMGTS